MGFDGVLEHLPLRQEQAVSCNLGVNEHLAPGSY